MAAFNVGLPPTAPPHALLRAEVMAWAQGMDANELIKQHAELVALYDSFHGRDAPNAGLKAALTNVYEVLDMTPEASVARLQALMYEGASALSDCRKKEAEFADLHEPLRKFRVALAAGLGTGLAVRASLPELKAPGATGGAGTSGAVATAAPPAAARVVPRFGAKLQWKGLLGSGYGRPVVFCGERSEYVAAGGLAEELMVYRAADGAKVHKLAGHHSEIWSMAVTPDKKHVVTVGGEGRLLWWDIERGVCVRDVQAFEPGSGAIAVCVLQDGRVVAGSAAGAVRLFSAEGLMQQQLYGHTKCVRSIVELPGGHIASGSDDKTVRVWSLRTGAAVAVLSGHTATVFGLCMLSCGLLVSASEDSRIGLWDVRDVTSAKTTVAPAATFLKDGGGWVFAAAELPDDGSGRPGFVTAGGGSKLVLWRQTEAGDFKVQQSLPTDGNLYGVAASSVTGSIAACMSGTPQLLVWQ